MPSLRRLFSSLRGHVRLRTIALVLIAGGLVVVAAPPPWWSGRGVTNQNPADDYAPINQGQLKTLVKAAVQELDATLPGGAGDTLHGMITRWAAPAAQPDDYAAVNLGQLKAAAAPVYDRLKTIGYVTAYPWASSAKPPDDYAMANIGQAKGLLAFDLTKDTHSVGIPDWWRNKYGLHFANANAALAPAPGGINYLQKYQFDLDPTKEDSDGDGYSDGDEIAGGTDPKNPASMPALNLRIAVKPSTIYRSKPGFPQLSIVTGTPKFYLKQVETYHLLKQYGPDTYHWSGEYEYTEEVIPSARKIVRNGWLTNDWKTYDSEGMLSGTAHYETAFDSTDVDTPPAATITGSTDVSKYTMSMDSSMDADDNWSSVMNQDVGLLNLQGSFPNHGSQPRWSQWGWFPMDTYNWSGTSSLQKDEYTGDSLTSSSLKSSTMDALGKWTGIETPGGTALNGWNFSDGMDVLSGEDWILEAKDVTDSKITYDWTYVAENDPTQTDYVHHCWGTRTLSGEYTTSSLITDALAEMLPYPAVWTEAAMGADVAYRHLGAGESTFSYGKAKYRVRANPSAAQKITWCEFFTPDDDPTTTDVDESTQIRIHAIHTWAKEKTQTQSPEYSIIPSEDEGNGSYTVGLLPVEVRAFQDEDGPYGSAPMYAPPRPDDGQPFGDLFSLWPAEQATFGIAEPIAGMLTRHELPAGTVKWSGDGLAEKTDVTIFDVQWWTPGLKHVNLQIGASIYHLYVNVPDTGSLDLTQNWDADKPLRDLVGRLAYIKIGASGKQMQNRVAIRYGQDGATGGTRQDAIRHSSWNAFAAEQVGKAKTLIVTTANEFHGQYFTAAFASNTTMDLHNNDVGATAGDAYFNTAPLKFPEELINEMEAKFDKGDLWAWTPPNANVNTHWHILKNSDRTKIFAP